MNWLENLLIVAGISLDIFAGMECQGSLVKKINKKHLFAICTVVAIGQLIELFLGYFLSDLFCRKYAVANEKMLGEIIAMLIFFAVGIRLMTKAVRNERIEEHLENDLGIKRFVLMVRQNRNIYDFGRHCIWLFRNECNIAFNHDAHSYDCICNRRNVHRISFGV